MIDPAAHLCFAAGCGLFGPWGLKRGEGYLWACAAHRDALWAPPPAERPRPAQGALFGPGV